MLKNGSVMANRQQSITAATISAATEYGVSADGKFNDLNVGSPISARRRSIFVRLKSFAMRSPSFALGSMEEEEEDDSCGTYPLRIK